MTSQGQAATLRPAGPARRVPARLRQGRLAGRGGRRRPVPAMYMWNYYRAMALLRAPIESYLRSHAPRPTCVVSDFCHPWTTELAANLGVPRLSFFSMCAFGLLCHHNLERFNAWDGVEDPNEPVVVPGLEERFVVTRAQAPGFFRQTPIPCWEEFADYVERARAEADGVIVNTVLEMEPEYVAGYAAAWKMKVWTVGPVSTYHQSRTTLASTLASRGLRTSAVDPDECHRWLDGKAPGSVVYVSFGSISQAEPKQVVELGLGLEVSGHPFIWMLAQERRRVRRRGARVPGRARGARRGAGPADPGLGAAAADHVPRRRGRVRDALRAELDAGGRRRRAADGDVAALHGPLPEREDGRGGAGHRRQRRGDGAPDVRTRR
uniref:Uncharacterized protein n=1 Tax=Setaria viridis TaxID=4556 RepID=A0A4V6DBC1_SETVI|nr:hypothetical protein SEVIR_4G081500v2 [Setaria viridis]